MLGLFLKSRNNLLEVIHINTAIWGLDIIEHRTPAPILVPELISAEQEHLQEYPL